MIRMNPAHDTVNPAGSIQPAHAEISLKEAIRRYEADRDYEADRLKFAYDDGYKKGYLDGINDSLKQIYNQYKLPSDGYFHIDPPSEAAR